MTENLFSVYIGTRLVANNCTMEEAIEVGQQTVKQQKPINVFVPPAVVLSQRLQTCVAVITDDANGIIVRRF